MATRTWNGADATTPNDWSVTGNWDEGAVPIAADDVRIPAGSGAITAGLNQSAVALGDFIVEAGYDQNIGSASGYLQVDPNLFKFATINGTQYIDVGAANIDLEIESTGAAGTGERALYLKGSNIATVSVFTGSVGIASRSGETSTVATCRVVGSGSVWLGSGVTLTTIEQQSGSVTQSCACTTATVYGGNYLTSESGAITTLNVHSGACVLNSSGTITTLNQYGGTVDFSKSAIARTVTTYSPSLRGSMSLTRNPNVITISTFNQPSDPYVTSFNRA